jgi:DNA-binding transcriptional MerR regulator
VFKKSAYFLNMGYHSGMATLDQTAKLVDSVLRLRRVEKGPGAADDIAPVRRYLESQLGPSLSRSRASQILGVSQTALDRWVASGQVPIVVTPSGRREVPRQFVIELAESIARLADRGLKRHPLAAALAERRDSARKLRVPKPSGRGERTPRGHETAERRSLAYHRAIAKRLDPQLVAEARERVDRLAGEGHLHPRYAERWRQLLALSIDEIADEIAADDPEAADLRQNSPFAGILNEQERRRIIEAVR